MAKSIDVPLTPTPPSPSQERTPAKLVTPAGQGPQRIFNWDVEPFTDFRLSLIKSSG